MLHNLCYQIYFYSISVVMRTFSWRIPDVDSLNRGPPVVGHPCIVDHREHWWSKPKCNPAAPVWAQPSPWASKTTPTSWDRATTVNHCQPSTSVGESIIRFRSNSERLSTISVKFLSESIWIFYLPIWHGWYLTLNSLSDRWLIRIIS